MNSSTDNAKYVVIGRVGRTYGVKGWLKIQSFTSPQTNIFDYQPWYYKQKGTWFSFECDNHEINANSLLIHVKDYDSPEKAQQLTGIEIAVKRSQLPDLPKGEYYWDDLIGLDVYNKDQVLLGKVVNIISNAAHPLLEIKGDKQHLIPLLFDKFIVEVDLSKSKMIADWDPEF